MGTSAQAKVIAPRGWKAWQSILATIGIAALTAYPLGMLFGWLQGEAPNCTNLGYISGCAFPNPFIFIIGLLYALPFWLGVFHFGFGKKKQLYYYIVAALFAKFLYVGMDVLVYEVAAIGGGIAVGLAVSAYRNKKIA